MSDNENDCVQCTECSRICDKGQFRTIDGKHVCLNCLYGDARPLTIYPIGIVISGRERGEKTSHASLLATDNNISEIHLYPGMSTFMKGLADETHLIIVWHLHQAKPVKTLFARGWDGKKVGPFASRTPNRLTPIAVTEVELLEVKGTTLIVRGLDTINGTPVLDIKVAIKSLKKEIPT